MSIGGIHHYIIQIQFYEEHEIPYSSDKCPRCDKFTHDRMRLQHVACVYMLTS